MPTPAADRKVRMSGLGGTDVAKVLGVSRFGGPFDVYAEKKGMSAPLVETEPMTWGLLLEDAVAKRWAQLTGKPVFRRPQTLRNPRRPYLFVHLDRLVGSRRTAEAEAILEVKTAGTFAAADFGEPDTDQVPADYYLQAVHQAAVADKPVVHFGVLIGGNHFRKFIYERDRELEAVVEARLAAFWTDHIVPGVPPAMDGSDGASQFLARSFPTVLVEHREMDEELAELARKYRAAHEAIARYEAEKKLAANEIKDRMGTAGVSIGDGITVRWSKVRGGPKLNLPGLLEAAKVPAALIEEFTSHEPDTRRISVDIKAP